MPVLCINPSVRQQTLQDWLSASPLSIPHNIPDSGLGDIPELLGRNSDLEKLHQLLQEGNRVNIHGRGGVGKTELAIQYARKHLGDYQGGICWLSVQENNQQGNLISTGEKFAVEIVNFAQSKFSLHLEEDWELKTKVEYCWENWHSGQVLIIVDNVTDSAYRKFKFFLPSELKRDFKVLITTRLSIGNPYNSFPLDVLKEEEAIELLISHLGKERIQKERKEAKKLCEDLGYLPVWLEALARNLEQNKNLSLAATTKQVKKNGLTQANINEIKGVMTADEGGRAIYESSWGYLDNREKELCYLLGLFADDSIPRTLLECSCSYQGDNWESIIAKIRSLYLLKGEYNYRVHSFTRDFFQIQLEKSRERVKISIKNRFCQTMAEVAKEIPESLTREQITELNPFIRHLEVATTLTNFLKEEDFCAPFVGVGRFYANQGFYREAKPFYENCLILAKQKFKEPNLEIASSQNNLAKFYRLQGRYKEAINLFEESLEITENLQGKEHINVATIIENLAVTSSCLHRYSDAEFYFTKALNIKISNSETQPRDIAQIRYNIALFYTDRGREYFNDHFFSKSKKYYGQAELYYQQALEIVQSEIGKDDISVANIKENLGLIYGYQRIYSEAESHLTEALSTKERLLGQDDLRIANTLSNLGHLYSEMAYEEYANERLLKAQNYFIQALKIKKKVLEENHPLVAEIKRYLDDVNNRLDNYL